jgi:hypothetical protein
VRRLAYMIVALLPILVGGGSYIDKQLRPHLVFPRFVSGQVSAGPHKRSLNPEELARLEQWLGKHRERFRLPLGSNFAAGNDQITLWGGEGEVANLFLLRASESDSERRLTLNTGEGFWTLSVAKADAELVNEIFDSARQPASAGPAVETAVAPEVESVAAPAAPPAAEPAAAAAAVPAGETGAAPAAAGQ